MQKLNSLINNLRADLTNEHPNLIFAPGEQFYFHPPETIFYSTSTTPRDRFDASTDVQKDTTENLLEADFDHSALLLFHELGHYLNHDKDYSSIIDLLRIESAAWTTAQKLATKYGIKWDEDFVQERLDTYRDFLHNKSLCSSCQINGYQDSAGTFHCPLCNRTW